MSQLFASGGQSIGASVSASVLPVNIHSLISFRIDRFDLAVQGTLRSLLQYHSSEPLIYVYTCIYMTVQLKNHQKS